MVKTNGNKENDYSGSLLYSKAGTGKPSAKKMGRRFHTACPCMRILILTFSSCKKDLEKKDELAEMVGADLPRL
jgi:hypothetical protein